MEIRDKQELIYPWNVLDYCGRNTRLLFNRRTSGIELDDETLRDGLQSPSVRMPSIDEKLKIVHYMNDLGIHIADVGLPAAGETMRDGVLRVLRGIEKPRICPTGVEE